MEVLGSKAPPQSSKPTAGEQSALEGDTEIRNESSG
jgi:hypothetical protein